MGYKPEPNEVIAVLVLLIAALLLASGMKG